MDLTQSESQLIALIRAGNEKRFSLEIRTDGRIWYVTMIYHDAAIEGDGDGETFEAAWDDMVRQE